MEFKWWDDSLVAEDLEDVDLARYTAKDKKDNTTADQAFQVGEVGARVGWTVNGIAAVVGAPTGADYVIPLSLLTGDLNKDTPLNYWVYWTKQDGRKVICNAGTCLKAALQQKGAGNNRIRVHNFILAAIGDQDASGKPNPKPTPAQLDDMLPGVTEYAETAATKVLGTLAVK